jgi:repressor LexA
LCGIHESEHLFADSPQFAYTGRQPAKEEFMERKQLTKRQAQIYDFICTEVSTKGYPPSVREIAEAVGLSSPSTVHTHLQVLEDKGYIKRDLSKPRALEIIGKELGDPAAGTSGTVMLPLVGKVAAGTPILAEQNIETILPLPTNLVSDAASFVLRVQGESMINAGILNGDFVVVKEQNDAVNGQIVVAMIDDEATVKTFYREPDRIRLQPENPTMDPIYATDPTILGRVVALVRSF